MPVPKFKKPPITRNTIYEIRRLLAKSLGVDIADVHITILSGNARGRVRRTSEQLSPGQTRDALSNACIDLVQKNGWTLSKNGAVWGRNSRIASHKNGAQEHIKIVTSQTGQIALTRDPQDQYWVELEGIDRFIIGCLDNPKKPLYAVVHAIKSDFLINEFNKARTAKMREGKWNPTSPLWLPIEAMPASPMDRASACMDLGMYALLPRDFFENRPVGWDSTFLTIPEAKRRLAISFHVDECDVLIEIGSRSNRSGKTMRR